jgi:hypothetical protein
MDNIASGTQLGTGAPINIPLGWTPARVRVLNITSTAKAELEHIAGMAAASAIKTVSPAARTVITTLGITLKGAAAADTFQGFILGADADVNVNGQTLVWFAERGADPTR